MMLVTRIMTAYEEILGETLEFKGVHPGHKEEEEEEGEEDYESDNVEEEEQVEVEVKEIKPNFRAPSSPDRR